MVAMRVPVAAGKSMDCGPGRHTPAFGAPNTTVGAAAFGTITSAGDPRVVQLALKFIF
jgi:hypothetical protein